MQNRRFTHDAGEMEQTVKIVDLAGKPTGDTTTLVFYGYWIFDRLAAPNKQALAFAPDVVAAERICVALNDKERTH